MKGQEERRKPTNVMGIIRINVHRGPQKNLGGNSGKRRKLIYAPVNSLYYKLKQIMAENR
jgi:hypothetical protein